MKDADLIKDALSTFEANMRGLEKLITHSQRETLNRPFAQISLAHGAVERMEKRINDLETRLEMNFCWQDGVRIAVKPGSIPDGIECRDATIKLLKDNIERLRGE